MEREVRASNPSTRRTLILSKRPQPGRVKTRLSPPLSPAEAAFLADGMLADAVARCAGGPGFATTLFFAPAGEERWFRQRFPALADQRPQRGASLGERLANAFDDVFAEPWTTSAVAIGSDQPLVSAARIEEAHRSLERGADLVLGPDAGGGYYLVGLRRPERRLFTEVPMSTGGMCAATATLARGLGLEVVMLPEGYDVDVEADLERLRGDLVSLSPDAPEFPRHTKACLDELFPPTPR